MFLRKPILLFAPDDKAGDSKKEEKDDILNVNEFKNPDDIDAKLNELDSKDNIEIEDTSEGKVEDDIASPVDPPEIEDKETETDKETVEVPDDTKAEADTEKKTEKEAPEKEAPVETDKAEPEKTDKVLLTDELISKMELSDDERKYLNKFKGQSLDAVLKSYANAQKLIGKKKEELFKNVEIPKSDVKVPDTQKPEEIQKAKDELIRQQLLKDFPDLPDDPTERKKWLADLNYEDPETALNFISRKKEVTKEIDDVYQKTQYLRENSGKINQERFKSVADTIQEYATEKLGINLKDYGYDLSTDNEGNNEILERLLSADDNPEMFDTKVVENWNGVKIVNDMALRNKFFERELPALFKKVREGSRKEGFESKSDKKVVQSLTTQANKGKGSSKEITADQIKTINDPSKIDELLDKEDEQFFSR